MDASDIDLVDDVVAQADAIVQDDDAGGDATHWNEEARALRALIAGVILHIVATEPLERRSLSRCADFPHFGPNELLWASLGS